MTNNNNSGHDSSKTYTFPKGTTLQKSSIISVLCRICYDGDKDEELIQPCNCKGTVAFVHKSCLETWLGESNTTACELCHTTFKTERSPRYTSRQSIWQWIRTNPSGLATAVRSDIVACAVITPLAIVITYICLFSSEYYNQKKFSNVPAARWTSISLLIMIGIMLIGYYMWVYSVIRMHARMWYNWWQRTCDVRYIAPTTVETHVAPVNEDVISDSRDASMPSENSDFSTDTHQATVIEMKELLKHMPPKQIQSRSQETHVIEMETVQSIDQPSIAGKTNTDELEPSGHITTADTRSLELKDNQLPSCSTTIQNLIQPPLGNTQDIDTQTRADFSCIRSGNIAACVSTAVSANQEFSKEILGNIGDEDQLICVSESIFSRTTLQSLNVSSMVEIGDKQGCSSIGNTAASQSEGVEPRESQVTACSHANSQHMIDVSSQASGSNIENK